MTDVVDTFSRIARLILKWVLLSIAALIAIGAIISAGVWGYNWNSYTRHAENVHIIINTEKKNCDDDKYPIYVFFGNRSSKTLERVAFTLRARVKGRSTNIADHHSYYDDHISAPDRGYGNCFAIPKLKELVTDPRVLEWDLESKTFTFSN